MNVNDKIAQQGYGAHKSCVLQREYCAHVKSPSTLAAWPVSARVTRSSSRSVAFDVPYTSESRLQLWRWQIFSDTPA